MKKLLITALSAIFALTLTACNTLDKVVVSSVNAAYVLDINGDSVEKVVFNAALSEEEQMTALSAFGKIRSLEAKYKDIEPQDVLLLMTDYSITKAAYTELYTIVVAHEAEYTIDEWAAFTSAHEAALQLDASLTEYLANENSEDGTLSTLDYIMTAAKLAALL